MTKSPRLPDSLTDIGRTRNTRYLKGPDDVVIVLPDEGAKDDAASARENVDFQMGYARELGRKCAFVVMMGPLLSQDAGAREVYATGMDPELTFASALVASNLLSRAIASFFVGLSKPKVPLKLFDSVEHALEWCETQRPAPGTP